MTHNSIDRIYQQIVYADSKPINLSTKGTNKKEKYEIKSQIINNTNNVIKRTSAIYMYLFWQNI